MSEGKTFTIKICLPDQQAVERFYQLMHAADEATNRWSREKGADVLERLREGDATDEERAFFAAAWDTIINTGDLGRLLTAFTTLEATFQDPAVDYVKAKPSIDQMAGDAWIMPVVLEAYEEAQREISYLQAACDFAGEILKNKRAPGGADGQ